MKSAPLLPVVFAAVLAASSDCALAKIEPIEFPPDSRTERDFEKAQRAWCEKILVGPFRERAQGQPWADAGTAFVTKALDAWSGDYPNADLPALSASGKALLADGCVDPLVGYLATWARWQATDEYYGSREEFLKWLKAAEALPGPKALARLIAIDFLRTNRIVKLANEGMPQKLAKLNADVWTDGSYLRKEDSIYLRHILGEPWNYVFNDHAELFWNELKQLNLPLWVRKTLLGAVELDRAWRSRGSGFADTVTPEGWKGFAEHLAKAREHLVKAWELRPKEPLAPSLMITVTMGGDVGEDETCRRWFNRATAAQCDFRPAYSRLATACMPRWGGDNDLLIEFASVCAATKRFDTDIPLHAFIALDYANADNPGLQLYRREEVAPVVLAVTQGLAAESTRTAMKRHWLGHLAVHAWLIGENKIAAEALEQCGSSPLPYGVLALLQNAGTDESIFRAEVAILNSPARDQFLAGQDSRSKGYFIEAGKEFTAAAESVNGIAANRLRALASVVDVEKQLEAGEWAKIPADPTISGWIQRSGSWFATPEGFPAIRDADGPVRVVYDAHVGCNFELRGVIDVSGEPKEKWAASIIYGDQGERAGRQRWSGAFVRIDKGDKRGTGRSSFRDYVLGHPAVKCPWKESNEFTLKVEDGKLTWTVNGVKIHKGVGVEDASDAARIGIGSFRHFAGVTVALRNLEVRRLTKQQQ